MKNDIAGFYDRATSLIGWVPREAVVWCMGDMGGPGDPPLRSRLSAAVGWREVSGGAMSAVSAVKAEKAVKAVSVDKCLLTACATSCALVVVTGGPQQLCCG
jgi:hypothetical protein